MLAALLIVVLGGISTGCGSRTGSQAPAVVAEVPPPASPPDARISEPPAPEPAGASRDELETIPPPPSLAPASEGWTHRTVEKEPEARPASAFGYRVQLFASSTYPAAEAFAQEARAKLGEPVAIEYEAPFYKVRAGNCVTRHDAERIRDRAQEAGYVDPFIAETMVAVD